MYSGSATIEVFFDGRWQRAVQLKPANTEAGYRGPCAFEYSIEYALEHVAEATAQMSGVSCRYPVDLDLHNEDRWPAFILDILPSGYGRQQWLEHLELSDGPTSDWPLLLRGTAFPPGNLRIAEAVAVKDLNTPVPMADGEVIPMNQHPGFSRDDVIQRNEYFIEYAYQHGIYAAGGSDVQGVAPKLLLNQDMTGAWHAEGVLPDDQVKAHWLVKRPRGRVAADRQVLRNEAAYMRVAQALGLRVHATLTWEEDNLFIPRFDRAVRPDGRVARMGMESLCSLAGISEYGVQVPHDTLCQCILRYCTDASEDLLEYIKRDLVNVVLGNKDNHARNTAVLRLEDGTVTLSPLFDFAPMYLDPEGIARVCRWEGEAEQVGNPEWAIIINRYAEYLPNAATELRRFAKRIARLPDMMRDAGVDDEIIEHRLRSIEEHTQKLMAL